MDVSEQLGLPPVVNSPLRSEIDYYGLSSIVAKRLQLRRVPRSFATWRHGWVFSPLKYTAQLVWSHFEYQYHLVATEKEASFLRDQGIKNVVAAGLPFIYADYNDVKRIQKSLLVMPPHTLPYAEHDVDRTGYVDYIKKVSGGRRIVFCLHQSCVERGLWKQILENECIDWVVGSSPHDPNSLLRMQRLFRMFEYMTTCMIGSHVVYAAYCGCKVSITGSFMENKKEDYQSYPYYLQHPEILAYNFEQASENVLKARFPFLYVPLDETKDLTAWAYEEVGASCRKSAEELKKYLGWDLRGQIKLRLHMLKRAVQNPTEVPRALLRRFAKKEVQ